jgi:hypothetical protein
MMIRLSKHGRKRALILDKSTLQAAGLDDNALFKVTINPNGGLTIQSVDPIMANFEAMNKKYKNLMQRLADL